MESFDLLTHNQFLLNVLAAVTCGTAIGIERQWRQRMAGLRTNALVATGASLFVMLNVLLPEAGDKTRIAAQVVSGIGFLGAGVIMREGLTIRGLNTAATLWCSAAVGVLAGFGLWQQAMMGTAVILGINLALKGVAVQLNRLKSVTRSENDMKYTVHVICRKDVEARIRTMCLEITGHSHAMILQGLQSCDLVRDAGKVDVSADIDSTGGKQEKALEKFISLVREQEGVVAASWRSRLGTEEAA